MTPSEKLLSLALDLENPENPALIEVSEENPEALEMVAASLIQAAEVLRKTAAELMSEDEVGESLMTPESLDEMAAIATEFDASDDEMLVRQAHLIDELLLTISADRSLIRKAKDTEDTRISDLKKVYQNNKQKQDELLKIKEGVEAIEKSNSYKEFRSMEHGLSSRYCADHPGFQTHRVSEHTVQCPVDNKIYNFDEGYILQTGSKVPGGDVSAQTKEFDNQSHTTFNSDTRANRHGQI